MTTPDPVKQAWQASTADASAPPMAEIRRRADRLFTIVRRRNRIEFAACAIVALAFAIVVVAMPVPVIRIGAALVILGSMTVAWQLHRRASAVPPPGNDGAEPILHHQRAQLERQRSALASVWLWYLAPLVPGFVTILLAPIFTHGLDASGLTSAHILGLAGGAIAFGGIWSLNLFAARRLARAIAEIDMLLEEEK